MARKVLSDTYYSFTPSSRTIVFNQIIQRERFVLITNLNTNQVIYNFSDPNLKITSYSTSTNTTTGIATTSIVLQYNTTAMSATDDLQVVIDEYEEKFTPSELYTDPVNKFRVSQPQALIDTDFEYSTQATKWESLSLVNNRPYAYQNTSANTIFSTGGPISVTAIAVNSNSSVVTVYTANTVAVNTPIFVTDTAWGPADGTFMVDSVTPGHAIRYTTKQRYINTAAGIANVNINIPGVSAVANGSVYSRANIGIANINFISTFANGQITTTQPHGLSLGNEVIIQGAFAATSGTPNGTYTITGVYSNTTFRIDANVAPVSSGGITSSLANLFSAGRSTIVHRAYDGGVEFGTAAEGHNNQLIRQTRRYFRYQSGKGIQMSTGTLIKPAMRVDSITSSGVVVTVRTKEPHFLDANVSINVANCLETAYNGIFNVRETIDPYTFTYVANSTPSSSTATGLYRVTVNNWFGAINRIGMFDDQNGLFFEYDGTTLAAVRRSSTRQLSGYVSANTSNTQIDGVTVNGVTTKFSSELEVGDYIVIKGMSYRVIEINSDTRLHISPAYRGETPLFQAVANKTIDYRYPQNTWNLDRCDGTGPSGYNIDLSRMQMLYLDYSWYGAGFVRWGFRGADGNIIYCHKVINNNVNYEAYMRSGNLPARYETNTFSRRTRLQATMNSGDSTMNVANASAFPTAGTLWVYGGPGGLSEFINYNGISNNSPSGWTFNNLTRGQPGTTINCVMSTTSTVLNLVAGQATTGIQPGMYVSNANIPGTAVITSVTPGVSIQLSQAPQIGGTGLVTFIPMGNTAQTFTFSTTSPTSVELHAPGYSPRLSHWGTSVIMDGRYDDDKSFVFTQGMSIARSVPPGQRMALQSFRVAPSVSNGVPGSRLGDREVINRMQMILRQLDLLSGGQFLMEILLNASTANAAPQWASVGGSSLVQYVNHTADTRIDGGEVIYGFFTNSSGGSTNLTTTSVELNLVRDLGNSILGGGTLDPNRGFYPDGPDIITVCARNVGTAAASIFSRLSWTEAQA
jgi:hypothetical protein